MILDFTRYSVCLWYTSRYYRAVLYHILWKFLDPYHLDDLFLPRGDYISLAIWYSGNEYYWDPHWRKGIACLFVLHLNRLLLPHSDSWYKLRPEALGSCLTRKSLSDKMDWKVVEPWWRHQMEPFSALLALCAGNSPVPVNSPHKGQWRGALMFSLICVWINGWVNNH